MFYFYDVSLPRRRSIGRNILLQYLRYLIFHNIFYTQMNIFNGLKNGFRLDLRNRGSKKGESTFEVEIGRTERVLSSSKLPF